MQAYFFGQFGEDKYLREFFSPDFIGTCVEVGAYDGSSGSNTLHFELNGWKCLCIEPIPEQYEKCRAIRRNVVNCCISDVEKDSVVFHIFNLGDNNNESAISSLEPDSRLIQSHSHLIKGIKSINVRCRTLTSVLDEANFPTQIDFISVDTENTELDVLKGFDFSKYTVKYFVIENNYDEPFCENYLKQFGFEKIHRTGVNDFFRNTHLAELYQGNKLLKYNNYHGEVQQGAAVDQTLRSYFPDPSYTGIFIDVGAYEPVNISNSYHFEMNDWKVVCFEANTDLIPELKKHRKDVYNFAISSESKESIEFNVVDGSWGGGSLTAGVSAINLDPQYLQTFGNGIRGVRKITVAQKSLNDSLPFILSGKTSIDIISIDVEGGEMDVLNGLDLTKYKVKVFVIENVFSNPNIGLFLAKYNYKLDKRIDYNEYYIPA